MPEALSGDVSEAESEAVFEVVSAAFASVSGLLPEAVPEAVSEAVLAVSLGVSGLLPEDLLSAFVAGLLPEDLLSASVGVSGFLPEAAAGDVSEDFSDALEDVPEMSEDFSDALEDLPAVSGFKTRIFPICSLFCKRLFSSWYTELFILFPDFFPGDMIFGSGSPDTCQPNF